jgi:peptidoglycan/LPS O-acetylase OafA/YrhL
VEPRAAGATERAGARSDARPDAPAVDAERASSSLGRHYEGLDGLRAVAVLLVLLYHGEITWARGGFLGVSLFFTLSGFLITGVLLRNHVVGGVGLRTFWVRRARRLMPAAFLALAGVVLFGATVAVRQQANALPGDVLSAATWTANWHFILNGTSYLALFSAPSPAQHFWSLAIEEQAYLLLPLVLLLLGRRRCSPLVIAAVLGAAAIASTAWMAVLQHGGSGFDRLYYGTDTRIAELLIGGALAALLARTGRDFSASVRRLLATVGGLGLAALLWWSSTASLADVDLYRGGLLAFSLLTCAAILAVLADVGPVRAVLSTWPLPPIGRISYGLYLYHWPIYLWLSPERTGLSGWPLLALRLAVTFAVAIVSYRWVEQPILHGALGGLPRWTRWALVPVVAATVVVAGAVFVDRSAPDPLAALRGQASAESTVARDDGVLDVLVIPQTDADPILPYRRAAAQSSGARLHLAPPLQCRGPLVATPHGRTCANWAHEWPALVRRTDPDAVLVLAGAWAGTPPSALRRLPVDHDAETISATLDAGFDLLGSRGAPLMWADLPTSGATGFYAPFHQAMLRLLASRTDGGGITGLPSTPNLTPDELLRQAAPMLLGDVARHQRQAIEDLPRILVVGDSQALSLGYGLDRWAAEHRRAVVWNRAVEGCGVVTDGELERVALEGQASRCQAAVRAWPRLLADIRPDTVVVLSSITDTQVRRLPGATSFSSPGDAALDNFLVREYRSAVETLSSTGATVVWMTAPCIDEQGLATALSPYDTTHMRHLDASVLPRLAHAESAKVRMFDLAQVVCPGGTPRRTVPGGAAMRPDGVHFSVEASGWLAEQYGDQILELGRATAASGVTPKGGR